MSRFVNNGMDWIFRSTEKSFYSIPNSFNRKMLRFVDNTDKQVLSIVLTNMCTHESGLLINCPLLLDLWKPWLWSRIISNTMSKLEHFERFPSNGNYLIVSLFQISVKETCPRSISPIRGQNTPPPFRPISAEREVFCHLIGLICLDVNIRPQMNPM